MTFGIFKSAVEQNLFESYGNDSNFKKSIKEFKQNILMNKSIAKVFALYDDLSTPQNLTEEEAKEFINEGILLIKQILKEVKLPKIQNITSIENKYKIIDDLVYTKTVNISERIKLKKQLIETLKISKEKISETVKVPLKTMVKIANQTISNYLENLDESDRQTLMEVLSEDTNTTEEKFNTLKESTITKLKSLISEEPSNDIKEKINETISKVKTESFNQLNYIKLLSLSKSI